MTYFKTYNFFFEKLHESGSTFKFGSLRDTPSQQVLLSFILTINFNYILTLTGKNSKSYYELLIGIQNKHLILLSDYSIEYLEYTCMIGIIQIH